MYNRVGYTSYIYSENVNHQLMYADTCKICASMNVCNNCGNWGHQWKDCKHGKSGGKGVNNVEESGNDNANESQAAGNIGGIDLGGGLAVVMWDDNEKGDLEKVKKGKRTNRMICSVELEEEFWER